MSDLFTVHMLNDEGKKKAEHIAHAFEELLHEVDHLIVNARQKALFRTHLEEASMHVKKGMAMLEENQEEAL